MWWNIVICVVAALVVQGVLKGILRKTGAGRLVRGSWAFWLWTLGICAAITVFMPTLVIVMMITIVGIPLGIALMAAPFLFLLVLGTWIIRRATGTDWMGTAAALVATLILLAIPPYIANGRLDRIAATEVADDHDEGTRPAVSHTMAIISSDRSYAGRDAVNCDGLCQRALMNGAASRVLVLQQDLNLPIVPSVMADSFRLERRAFCPPVKLPQGNDPIEIADERQNFRGKSVSELMQLEIAKGNCLIAEQARLGTADLILSVGTVRKGLNALRAGLSLYADTVNADRITMHEKKDGAFAETYRKTFVVSYKLLPFYAPTIESGAELRAYAALARRPEMINIDTKYYNKPDWSGFLTKRLGMDLALRRDSAASDTRAVLETALQNATQAPSLPVAVAEAFFSGLNDQRNLVADDYSLTRRLLEDTRFPVSRSAYAAIRNAKDAPEDYFDAIAVAMFKRLRLHSAAGTVKVGSGWHEELASIGNVLAAMPQATILKHEADLDWLSHEDAVRVQAHDVLPRYADFGAKGGKPLLWLIDDAQRFRQTNGNEWQHPYLAGLIGLCKLGADGREAIQPLFDRLDSGVIASWGSYNRLAVHTLARMGADREDIWRHAKPKKPLSAKDMDKERQQFDREVERATRREECWY